MFASTATGEKRVRILLRLYAHGTIGRGVLDAEGVDPPESAADGRLKVKSRILPTEATVRPEQPRTVTDVKRRPCVHLGPVRRQEQCKPCRNGSVLADVRACDLFGECTLGPTVLRIRACTACDKYAPGEAASEPGREITPPDAPPP